MAASSATATSMPIPHQLSHIDPPWDSLQVDTSLPAVRTASSSSCSSASSSPSTAARTPSTKCSTPPYPTASPTTKATLLEYYLRPRYNPLTGTWDLFQPSSPRPTPPLPRFTRTNSYQQHNKSLYSYRLASIPKKGYGLLATTTIAPRDEVFTETPLLSCPPFEEPEIPPNATEDMLVALGKDDFHTHLISHLEKYPQSAISEFYKLHNNHRLWSREAKLSPFGDYTQEEGIWHSNCFQKDEDGTIVIFKLLSRVNHDCHPNSTVDLGDDENDVMHARLVTKKAVRPGEELTVSYLSPQDLNCGVAERRRLLAATWGFWCSCGKCEYEARVDEIARKRREAAEQEQREKDGVRHPPRRLRGYREWI